jgi:hypothetical protein
MSSSFIYTRPPADIQPLDGIWEDRAPDIKTRYLGISFVDPSMDAGYIADVEPANIGPSNAMDQSSGSLLGLTLQRHLGRSLVISATIPDIQGITLKTHLGTALILDYDPMDIRAYSVQRYIGSANLLLRSSLDIRASTQIRFIGSANVLSAAYADMSALSKIRYIGKANVLDVSSPDILGYMVQRYIGRSNTIDPIYSDVFGLVTETNVGSANVVAPSLFDIISLGTEGGSKLNADGAGANVLNISDLDIQCLGAPSDDNISEFNPFGGTIFDLAVLDKKYEKDILGVGDKYDEDGNVIPGGATFGPFLRFVCESDRINLVIPLEGEVPDNWLFSNLTSFRNILEPKNKRRQAKKSDTLSGLAKNDPNHPRNEAPRLLTHLIFDPITKPAISTYYLTYTLDVSVAPTPPKDTTDFQIPDEYRTDSTYEYYSTEPSDMWTIHHQLGYIPNVVVFINEVVDTSASITHFSENTTILKFSSQKMGVARLS